MKRNQARRIHGKHCFTVFGILLLSVCSGRIPEMDPALFPGLAQHADEALQLQGIARLYPGRIIFKAPVQATPPSPDSRAVSVESLPGNITYLRIYQLDGALPTLVQHLHDSSLILDVRYLQSFSGVIDFGKLFTDPKLQTVGTIPEAWLLAKEADTERRKLPAVVLCNQQTAGPLEAMLAQLQEEKHILAVGSATAGRTGYYSEATELNQTWILSGEIRPNPELSLIPNGFKPRILIPEDAKSAYRAYYLYEAGTPIEQLVAKTEPKPVRNGEGEEPSEEDQNATKDFILQKAIDVVAALQILDQVPK